MSRPYSARRPRSARPGSARPGSARRTIQGEEGVTAAVQNLTLDVGEQDEGSWLFGCEDPLNTFDIYDSLNFSRVVIVSAREWSDPGNLFDEVRSALGLKNLDARGFTEAQQAQLEECLGEAFVMGDLLIVLKDMPDRPAAGDSYKNAARFIDCIANGWGAVEMEPTVGEVLVVLEGFTQPSVVVEWDGTATSSHDVIPLWGSYEDAPPANGQLD